MNVFQKQLILGGKTMAELHNEGKTLPLPKGIAPDKVALAPAPRPVTLEDFEADRRKR